MSESNTEINYKEAYEREHEKCADLADKIVVLESEKEDLQFKLNRIKKNKFWKATGPARSVIHFAQRQKERLSHCGGPQDHSLGVPKIFCGRSVTRVTRRA